MANLVLGSRQVRQQEALGRAVEEVKKRAAGLETKLRDEYEVSADEAVAWLANVGVGFLRFITFLSERIPPDFLRSSRDDR